VENEHLTIGQVAQFRAESVNTFTARKPGNQSTRGKPTTREGNSDTRSEIEVLSVSGPDARGKVQLRVRLVNQGETV
jgi:hypothetical protein